MNNPLVIYIEYVIIILSEDHNILQGRIVLNHSSSKIKQKIDYFFELHYGIVISWAYPRCSLFCQQMTALTSSTRPNKNHDGHNTAH
jgi:hypothetical protein